jgi:hypothetical protein
VTDGIEQWVLDLPLWLQTPLTLVVLVLVASAVAAAMIKVAFGVLPATEDELQAFGSADAPADPPHDEGETR